MSSFLSKKRNSQSNSLGCIKKIKMLNYKRYSVDERKEDPLSSSSMVVSKLKARIEELSHITKHQQWCSIFNRIKEKVASKDVKPETERIKACLKRENVIFHVPRFVKLRLSSEVLNRHRLQISSLCQLGKLTGS